MRKNEIVVGGLYEAKVSNQITVVRVDRIQNKAVNVVKISGSVGTQTLYHVTNLRTKRTTVFRSAAKFRCAIQPQLCPKCKAWIPQGDKPRLLCVRCEVDNRAPKKPKAIPTAKEVEAEPILTEQQMRNDDLGRLIAASNPAFSSNEIEENDPVATLMRDDLSREHLEGFSWEPDDPCPYCDGGDCGGGPYRKIEGDMVNVYTCGDCDRGWYSTLEHPEIPQDEVEENVRPERVADRLRLEERVLNTATQFNAEGQVLNGQTRIAAVQRIEEAKGKAKGKKAHRPSSPLSTALREKIAARPEIKGCPHIVVEALAGTGKTTTLVEGLKKVKGLPTGITPTPQQQAVWDLMALSAKEARTIGFVAFNKSIAEELKSRVPTGCDAMTMHSMGFKAVRRAYSNVKVESYRVQNIISEMLEKDIRDLRRETPVVLSATEDLVRLCKVNLVCVAGDQIEVRERLSELASYYDIDLCDDRTGASYADQVFDLIPRVLLRCADVGHDGCLDFADMIWLPVYLNLPIFKYDLLLVDECVPGWTPVMLADGSSMTIKEIVESDEDIRVRSYNTKKGIGQNCRVVGRQKILNQKPLVRIKVQCYHTINAKTLYLICTTDHKVWTINRGWVPAGDIMVGDNVIIETAAKTTQSGKISNRGKKKLARIQQGNKRGLGGPGNTKENFNKIKGGNGRGPTLAEEVLLKALGDGWVYSHVVKTGDAPQHGRGNRPSHYKIDVANPDLKVAVELDGHSHRGAEEIDQKKTRFLESRGWTVFRIPNRQAIQSTSEVVCEILGQDNCPRSARVAAIDPINIPDNYVYDITVEGCHNFYANGILVHNCQDLSRCQQELAKRAGNRLVLCGDPHQAIYAFAGADSDSIPRMTKDLEGTSRGCVTLPLTFTRRCGKAIVEEARKIVPHFNYFEQNGEGKISKAKYPTQWRDKTPYELPYEETYLPTVKDGDFVLCRVNAPLVGQCFRFLKRGRKATIQGRDIGSGLISTVKKLKADSITDLVAKVSNWVFNETTKEQAKRNPNENKIISLQDRADCIFAFTEGVNTVQEVISKIEAIFTDDKNGIGIKLSSIHRSKGLEAKRVFFLQPRGGTCPHPMAQSEWQRRGEQNLLYVGITRSIEELIWVS